MSDGPGRVDRRTVLAAVAGLAGATGLAGCTGGGESGGSDATATATRTPTGTTDPVGDATGTTTDVNVSVGGGDDSGNGDDDDGNGGATGSIEECPQLPGSFTGFDPGSTPLPVRFEYPSAMQGTLTYVSDRNWEDGNAVVGTIQRGSDQEGDGDIALTVGVDYFARYADGREEWYEKRSNLEEFATTSFGGESVTFLTGETGGPYGGEYNGHTTVGLIPYDLSAPDKRGYFRAILGIEALLYRADVNDVTEACGENQRATLERVVSSLSRNGATTFGEYVDP